MLSQTAWMRACAACQGLANAMDAAAGTGRPPLAEYVAFQEHLVSAHLRELPGYHEGCPYCQEWRALAAAPEGLPPGVVPVLGREDLLHRAGHLISPVPRKPEPGR